MRVYSSVVLIPLFGIDVPASSEGIRFSTEFTRVETDDEVELVEVLRPAHLAACEHLGGGKVLEVLMVSHHIDRGGGTFKIVTPGAESLEDGEELLIMSVVIQFWRAERA
jgi:hypothetical protein